GRRARGRHPGGSRLQLLPGPADHHARERRDAGARAPRAPRARARVEGGVTMAGGAPTTNGAITSINVTPLVDITLVLLIVFMVTAKLIVSHKALPVDLPKAASGSDEQEIFSVVLLASGEARVDGEALPDDDAVLARARAAEGATPDLR